MNGKKARELRRIAESVTVGQSKETTREAYRAYKTKFKLTEVPLRKPIFQRNPFRTIRGAVAMGDGIPTDDRFNSSRSRIVKGFKGMTKWRYHPTKGYRREHDFDPSMLNDVKAINPLART